MQVDVLTLFPQWFQWFTGQKHIQNLLASDNELRFIDFREHTQLSCGQVDDYPYGGGAGMLLRVDVIDSALEAIYQCDALEVRKRRRVVALTPSGRLLDDQLVNELAAEESLTLLCGRYEGFDQRILDHYVTDEVSIGRYVLAGGELPAMVVLDAVLRKLPGALGDDHSAVEESYSQALAGAPEYPHYTRPAEFRGFDTPEILLSGHHQNIQSWRHEQSRLRQEAEKQDLR